MTAAARWNGRERRGEGGRALQFVGILSEDRRGSRLIHYNEWNCNSEKSEKKKYFSQKAYLLKKKKVVCDKDSNIYL